MSDNSLNKENLQSASSNTNTTYNTPQHHEQQQQPSNSNTQRKLSHLNSQMAQLNANLCDFNDLLSITCNQFQSIEKLGKFMQVYLWLVMVYLKMKTSTKLLLFIQIKYVYVYFPSLNVFTSLIYFTLFIIIIIIRFRNFPFFLLLL